MIVKERVANEADVVDVGEKIEKRITRARNQDFVAGIAEKTKNVGVGFAGARGEEEIGRRNICVILAIVSGDGFAGQQETLRGGFITERRRSVERGENCRFVIGEAAFGGIGHGEIEKRALAPPMFGESEGEAILGEIPIGTSGEHGGVIVQEKGQELEAVNQTVIWNQVWWARVQQCDRVEACVSRGGSYAPKFSDVSFASNDGALFRGRE